MRPEDSMSPQSSVETFVRPKPSLYMGGTATWKNDEIEDIVRATVIPRTKYVAKSNSAKAQQAKEALEADSYNLQRIIDLGYVYASEVQYDKAANVLIRGWKRVGELEDSTERFMFLMKLSEVSFRNRQFKQAHAVLMDIDEQEDYYEKKAYQLLCCHVFAEVGQGSEALSMFSKAIDGESFENSIKIWAACALRLKKVGGHEAGKESLVKKARRGPNYPMDQSRIQTVESWAIMSEQWKDENGWNAMFNLEDGLPKWMIKVLIFLACLFFVYLLYWLETRNLHNMKML